MAYRLSAKQAAEVISKIRCFIKEYFHKNNLAYAVFGKSEGLDSSVIAALLSGIEGIKPIGVIMPCESDPEAERIARIVLDHFRIPSIHIELTREFHFLMGNYYSTEGVQGQISSILKYYDDGETLKSLPHRKARAAGNIKARLRMITLYHIAQLTGGIVISTDNLSEFWMGFWTLNGDVGDLSPIQYVWKGLEEYTIAEALGVPRESLEAVPTDGLDVIPGGIDEDQLGLPYEELDRIIIALLNERFPFGNDNGNEALQGIAASLSLRHGFDQKSIIHVAGQIRKTQFKRNWPCMIRRAEIGLKEISEIDI